MRGEFSDFRKNLLAWYDTQKRALPWRANPDLYKTVVSEFMLQQTQVDTVIPYFERWMRFFPDFAILAQAKETAVLKAWEGLGYYSRARNLHRLAQSIQSEGVPETVEAWRERPGIGPYTAAAISSIAQNQPEPVIDGNVIRVLSRIQNDPTPFKSAAEGQKRLFPMARRMMDPHRPGDYNEAIMELGATVCRKTRPACLMCPVREHCKGLGAGTQEALPVIARKATRKRDIHRLWLVRNDALALYFYPETAKRLGGVAELPELSRNPGSPPLLRRSRGISSEQVREHIHRLNPEHPLACECLSLEAVRFVSFADLDSFTLSGPHRRWVEELMRKVP
jgi:A/G-specific adenine glycosylase